MLRVRKRAGEGGTDRIQEVKTAWGLLDHQVVNQMTIACDELGANTTWAND